MTPEILGIIGVLISIGLAINAFFLKELVEKLTQVRIGVATIASELNGTIKRVDTSENNQKDIFYRLHKLETKDKHI